MPIGCHCRAIPASTKISMVYFGLMQSMIISSYILSFVVAFLPDSTVYFSNGNRTTWTNNNQSLPRTTEFTDGSLARFILFKTETGTNGSFGFGFGFYCNCPYVGYCDLSIMFVDMLNGEVDFKGLPQVVWTANWNRRVGENATLKYNQGGNLCLIDEHGNEVWSSYPSGKSNVVGMSIDESGNMMLFNESSQPVWESSQYPTDTLLMGQIIMANRHLTSRTLSLHDRQSLFNLSLNSRAIVALLAGDEPTRYLTIAPAGANDLFSNRTTTEFRYLQFVRFIKGGMCFYYQTGALKEPLFLNAVNSSSNSTTVQFLRLDTDGGLRIYGWNPGEQWRSIYFWPNKSDECWIPLRCGRYGVCKWGTCGCPIEPDGKDYFTLKDYQHPHHGCREITLPLTFQGASTDYEMVHFGNLSYFNTFFAKASKPQLYTEERCKQACFENTTCKAAFFVSKEIDNEGSCYMYSEMLSLMGNPHVSGYYLSSYLKVTSLKFKVNVSSPGQEKTNFHSYSWGKTPLAVYSFLITVIVLVALCFVLWKKINCACEQRKHLKSLISGSLIRFSYSEMSFATAKFSTRLGTGGFGVVYKGVLKDGIMVAVKRLENTGQGGIEEFLAEVNTLGNRHHINLVKLIGFCVEKSHRILVYEYMSKGSLDKWIFHGNSSFYLDWKTRKKIVLDIAKGLAYIHGDCRQRIAHLDVKPQNILLDDGFNAKISDFGLSKLINRDESEVVTRMRGTLGYLAPEWQHARITVKADIYSFGIVVLEVVTGRMILDYSQPDSDVCLLKLLKKKRVENRLMDIIELEKEDVEQHFEEVNAMILLGLWCVNEDHTSRPSMNYVVKLLEQDKIPAFDCDFTNSI
ncbi:hypothetical protein F3Y22_tig00110556pilonHSYRG00294 [Hibiscus syriacus]|uniref:Receptor-like serine/threonine-protein kinase n=1 Tax=Hibiscus syriacus TaxID=106335 RepID=A0A6A3A832_HIBSY|nr:hypothetical protein F3Y22_tig00110556pilonHSYRG00294 [Hibiscus syriacus]